MSEGKGNGPEIPSFMFDKEKIGPRELVVLSKKFNHIIEETPVKEALVSESKGSIKFVGVVKKSKDGEYSKGELK